MRLVLLVVYCVMALWLLISAFLRVVLSLRAGVPLDVLPPITGALGLVALMLAAPRAIGLFRNRQRPQTGQMIEVPHDRPRETDPPAS